MTSSSARLSSSAVSGLGVWSTLESGAVASWDASALSGDFNPTSWLGVMANVGSCPSSLCVRGVVKCRRFGLGPVLGPGVACCGWESAVSFPLCVAGVALKKLWIEGDPLMPAPLHSLRRLAERMTL